MTGTDAAALFADVARIGPFFAVATGAEPDGGDWVSLAALTGPVDRADDPLRARVVDVAAALDCDERVAASIAFQGLAAQLVAPLYAAVVVHGALPVPDRSTTATRGHGASSSGPRTATCDHEALTSAPTTATCDHESVGRIVEALYWRPGGPGPWLWWPGTRGRVVDVPEPSDALADLLGELLGPLLGAVRARVSVSEQVLLGNAASAVASARRLVIAARPGLAGRATAVTERLLTAPLLAGVADLRPPEPPDDRWTFRRRSCCLYYRVPGCGTCGDCVLPGRPVR